MIIKENIKHILFDLGGVLLNIDYNLTERAFKKIGLHNFDEIYSQARQSGLFDNFEVGSITGETFTETLLENLPEGTSKSDIIDAWNAMLLDFPVRRLNMLEDLSKQINISLLSNTNEIHYSAFNKLFESAYKRPFDELFTSTYYSHVIGMRKPDKEVFLHILDKEKVHPQELLFIDDSMQHIEGAKKLQINTLFLDKIDDVVDLLGRSDILT